MEIAPPEDSANFPDKSRKDRAFRKEEARAKLEVSRLAVVRAQSFERVKRFVPLVEQAHAEIGAEYHRKFYEKDVSYRAIAKWLNQYGDEHGDEFLTPRRKKWTGKQVAQNLMEAPSRIIEEAVLECRTRVTAMALGRAFTDAENEITELEHEYLGYIADALEIEQRLIGNSPKPRDQLLVEARHKAIAVAAEQRREKELSMMARERLWKHFPPAVKKVFQRPDVEHDGGPQDER